VKFLLSIFIAVCFCVPNGVLSDQISRTMQLTKEQESWVLLAERHERAGWIYLPIGGQPRERGFQYGYLMAKEIMESLRVRRVVWAYATATEWTWLVAKSKKMISPKVDAEIMAEIDGIVEGLKAAWLMAKSQPYFLRTSFLDLFFKRGKDRIERIAADILTSDLPPCLSPHSVAGIPSDC
jgi:hypothetical protein